MQKNAIEMIFIRARGSVFFFQDSIPNFYKQTVLLFNEKQIKNINTKLKVIEAETKINDSLCKTRFILHIWLCCRK